MHVYIFYMHRSGKHFLGCKFTILGSARLVWIDHGELPLVGPDWAFRSQRLNWTLTCSTVLQFVHDPSVRIIQTYSKNCILSLTFIDNKNQAISKRLKLCDCHLQPPVESICFLIVAAFSSPQSTIIHHQRVGRYVWWLFENTLYHWQVLLAVVACKSKIIVISHSYICTSTHFNQYVRHHYQPVRNETIINQYVRNRYSSPFKHVHRSNTFTVLKLDQSTYSSLPSTINIHHLLAITDGFLAVVIMLYNEAWPTSLNTAWLCSAWAVFT